MDRDITTKLNYWNLLANKNLFRLFFRKTEICQTWKIKASYILSSSAKSCWGHDTYILLFCIDISTKLYQGLWFNWTHLLLFQNMSIEIHTNFYNRRLELQYYLTDKMRQNVSSYFAERFGIISISTRVLLLVQEVKMIRKSSKILSWDSWV